MKKNYIKPQFKVVTLESASIICVSQIDISDEPVNPRGSGARWYDDSPFNDDLE